VHSLITESEIIHGSGSKILDEDIHLVDEAQAEFKSLRLLQIDRDPLFAAIKAQEETRDAAMEWRSPSAPHIAVASLQLVDIRPIIGEQESAIRARERM
jgi:hypothetical protein